MSEQKSKVLVLFAHPSQHRSEVNMQMARAARAVDGVTVVDLYAEYPTYDIDIDLEQARLREHDVVIFLHPLYWYSTPSVLKEWQDLVLEYGFAYGSEGTALHGKIFFSALTTGGPEDAYCAKGYNHFSIRQLLQPLEQMASLCGMEYLPPFVMFAARSAREHQRVDPHVDSWTRLLRDLCDRSVSLSGAAKAETLNEMRQKSGAGA